MTMRTDVEALSLRISVTSRCQLRCRYCAPPEGMPQALHASAMTSDQIVEFVRALARLYPLRKVHLTGGEPLTRPDIVDLVARLAREGPADLALTTNGQRLAAAAGDLRRAGLGRINISLDSLDADTYRRLTRGGQLAPVIAGIEAARHAGFDPIKINMVVLRDINDQEVAAVARFGLERGCQVRLLELMPIGVARPHFDEWFISTAEVRERLAADFSLEPAAGGAGASSRNYFARSRNRATEMRGGSPAPPRTDRPPGATARQVRRPAALGVAQEPIRGIIGFISPCSDSFCSGCRRLRLTADGRLLGCLAQPEGADVRAALHAAGAERDARLAAAVEAALALKRAGRRFAAQGAMIAVGG
jgi:cyclic pyranopterin phosphate synthase